MSNSIFNTLALACCMALGAVPAAASVTSQQQGLHQWPVLKGKLILVNGTYHDTTSDKRSLTSYFESKAGADWMHVPVIDSASEQALIEEKTQ